MSIACMLGLMLADAGGFVTGAYWVCLIVGGGMLLLSLLGGGGDDALVEAGADAGLDAGFDAHADAHGMDALHAAGAGAMQLSTWFSLRFVVFFVAAFGMFGVILRYTTTLHTWTAFSAALVGGLLVGQGAHQTFHLLKRTSGNTTPQPQDYVHRLAQVTIPIVPPGKGEIVLQVRGSRRYIPAEGDRAEEAFQKGEDVVVVGYRAGVAQVVARRDFKDGREIA